MDVNRAAFDALLVELAVTAQAAVDVVGLVAFGSTAARDRVDEWSDHDFAWLVVPGAEARYRDDLAWLPDASRISLSVTADHGGVTVIYDDAHVLEFGIAAVSDFAGWAGDRAEVIVGDESVHAAVAAVLRNGATASRPDPARDVRLAVAKLLIGVGRARRGEFLSASGLIRDEAAGMLLRAILGRSDPSGAALDPRRRFELAYPVLAQRIETACRRPPEEAARELLVIADDTLAPGWPDYPHAALAVLRRRLGWD